MKWCELLLEISLILSIALTFLPLVYRGNALKLLEILLSISLFSAIVARGFEVKRFPVVNLYESLIFLAWGLSLVTIIFSKNFLEIEHILLNLLIFIIIGVSTLLPPWEKAPHYLIPALKSYWLYFHVTTSFLSYSGFFAAAILGFLYLITERKERKKLFDKLSYQITSISFLLLSTGILTGAVWAHYAWGRYWSWDPKETWSLITWIIYAGYLHARITRGWGGKKSAIWLLAGFLATLFTFLGVNYLLPGLHSYL